VDERDSITGYRVWKTPVAGDLILKSDFQDYTWKPVESKHPVAEFNSGLYAYNNNNNYYYNNYDNNYYNNYYKNYYQVFGVIKQWGRVAIHLSGQRSENAKITILFTTRESDAKGPKEFLNWIRIFNKRIVSLATIYNCKTQHYQDFLENIA
jgi:hypothetical protein